MWILLQMTSLDTPSPAPCGQENLPGMPPSWLPSHLWLPLSEIRKVPVFAVKKKRRERERQRRRERNVGGRFLLTCVSRCTNTLETLEAGTEMLNIELSRIRISRHASNACSETRSMQSPQVTWTSPVWLSAEEFR